MSERSSSFSVRFLSFFRNSLKRSLITLTIITLIASFFAFIAPVKTVNAAEPVLDYAVAYGGSGVDYYYAEPATNAVDSSGNLYTGGYFEETIDFDPGAGTAILSTCEFCADLYIQKLDSSGNLVWVKQFTGDVSGNWLNEIALDPSGNVYAVGVFNGIVDFDPGAGVSSMDATNGDGFVVKLDSNGDFAWAKQYSNGSLDVIALDVDSSGNVFVGGSFRGTLDVDPGAGVQNFTSSGLADDGFIVKLDTSGNFVWAQQIGSTEGNAEGADTIYIDSSNNVFVLGNFSGTVDFDASGGTTTLVGSSFDGYVLKLGNDGTFSFVKGIFSTSNVSPFYINTDSSGNLLMAGTFSGNADFDPGAGTTMLSGTSSKYAHKLDSNGDFVWAVAYGDATSPRLNSAQIDSDGSIYLYGRNTAIRDVDPGAGTQNIDPADGIVYLLKLDSNGQFEWVQQFADNASFSYASDMVIGSDDTIYATGGYDGTGDFDPSVGVYNMTSQDQNGNGEPFAIKLSVPAPTLTWTLTQDFQNNAVVGPDMEFGTGDDGTDGDATTINDVRPGTDEASLRALEFISGKAGDYYTAAGIKADGTLWTAGDVFGGVSDPTLDQLCHANAYPYLDTLTQVGLDTDWAYFNAGFDTLHMIKEDGTLWGCGEADGGQLGDGTTDSKNVPTQIGTDSDWTGVWGADWHTIGQKADGSIWAWGADWCGNLGQGTEDVQQNSPVQIGTDTDWNIVSAGDTHNLAIKDDGTLWGWGCDYAPGELGMGNNPDYSIDVPTQIGTDTDWAFAAAGFMMSAAIKQDGSLWFFGEGYATGLGHENAVNVPTQVGTDTDWEEVSVGFYHILARKTDGTIWGWGTNTSGEIGLGFTSTVVLTPTQIGTDTDWATITAAEEWSMAMKTDGSMWTAGANFDGQLALGDLNDRTEFTEVYFPPYYTTGAASGYKVYAGAGNVADWTGLSWNTSALPAGTEVRFRVRTSSDNVTYSAWSSYFTQDVDGSTSGTADLTSITDAEYLDIEFSFTTTDVLVTPTLLDFTLDYNPTGGVGGGGGTAPTTTSAAASAITDTTATLNGEITAEGSSAPTERGFEYGLDNTYGTTVSDTGTFTTGVFSEALTGLTCNTLYHFRAFSTSPDGTGNGSDQTFTTSACVTPPAGGGSSSGSSTTDQTDVTPTIPPTITPVIPGIPNVPTIQVPQVLQPTPCMEARTEARAIYNADIAANTAAYNQTILALRATRDQARAAAVSTQKSNNAAALATLRSAQALDNQIKKEAADLRKSTKAAITAKYNETTKTAAADKKAADKQADDNYNSELAFAKQTYADANIKADNDYNSAVAMAKSENNESNAKADSDYNSTVAAALANYNSAVARAGKDNKLKNEAKDIYNEALKAAKDLRAQVKKDATALYNQKVTEAKNTRKSIKDLNKDIYDQSVFEIKLRRTQAKEQNKAAYDQRVVDARSERATALANADAVYNSTIAQSAANRAAANATYTAAVAANKVTRDNAMIAITAAYNQGVSEAQAVRAQANAAAAAKRDAAIAAVCNPAPPAPEPTVPPVQEPPVQPPVIDNQPPAAPPVTNDTSENTTENGSGVRRVAGEIIEIFTAAAIGTGNAITQTAHRIDDATSNVRTELATLVVTNLALLAATQPLSVYSGSGSLARPIASFKDYLLFYQRYMLNIFSFLGFRKKRRVWGTVYDSETKQPLDPAVVELIDATTGEVKERAITDLAGRFGFLLTTSGTYVLRASKTHYSFPSKTREGSQDEFYDHLYHGEKFEITEGSQLVTPNIPMDPVGYDWNQEAKQGLIAGTSSWSYRISLALSVLFWGGFVYSIFSFISQPGAWNFIIFVLYILAIAIKKFIGPKRLWGRLFRNGQPLGQARIELLEHQMGVVMGKALTAPDGKFFLKTPQGGDYKIQIKSNVDGPVIFEDEVNVGKDNVFNEEINLASN